MIFFNFFLTTIDPAHYIYNIQHTENLFQWNLLILKFSSAAPTIGQLLAPYCLGSRTGPIQNNNDEKIHQLCLPLQLS